MTALLLIVVGMIILVAGAEGLVRGASRIAAAVGVSPLVIGLTVVAFGTSAPELAVSVGSALSGAGGVAVGNAIGSNIFNVLAVLGLAAVFGGLVVDQRIVRLDVPLMIAATVVVWGMAADGRLSLLDGVVLLVGIVVYTVFSYIVGRRDTAAVEAEYEEAFGPEDPAPGVPRSVLVLVAGLAGLVLGARLLVDGATTLAASMGVSDLVIGLTVVAVGTSLPELATSVVAARRGERDIAVGNVVGSNMFNLLAVLGAAAVASGGLQVPDAALASDLPIAALVSVVALPALAVGLRVAPWEGVLLLLGYVGYTVVVVVDGSSGGAAGPLRLALIAWLVVLAALSIGAGVVDRRRSADR